MIRVPTHREPTHPGEMLFEEFPRPMALSQRDLAEGIHVPYQRINELVHKKRGMTPSTALRLEKFFGRSADDRVKSGSEAVKESIRRPTGLRRDAQPLR
jgi:addiction module HigA family antidote